MPSYMLHFDAVYPCCIDYENIKLVTGVVMNRVGNFFLRTNLSTRFVV